MKEDGGEHQGLSSGPSYRRDDAVTPAFCPEYLECSSSACWSHRSSSVEWKLLSGLLPCLMEQLELVVCAHWRSGLVPTASLTSANKLQKSGQQTPLLIAGLLFVWQVSCDCRSWLAGFRQLPLAGRIARGLQVPAFWSPASCWSVLWRAGVPHRPPCLPMAWGSVCPGSPPQLPMAWGPGWAVPGSWCWGCANLFSGC